MARGRQAGEEPTPGGTVNTHEEEGGRLDGRGRAQPLHMDSTFLNNKNNNEAVCVLYMRLAQPHEEDAQSWPKFHTLPSYDRDKCVWGRPSQTLSYHDGHPKVIPDFLCDSAPRTPNKATMDPFHQK